MILDQGAVRFSLDRYEHGSAERARVILLSPGVPHDGRTVNTVGFRKRVLNLDTTALPPEMIGARSIRHYTTTACCVTACPRCTTA